MDPKEKEEMPALELTPSEEYHPRPLWQRVVAFVLIGLIVAATVVYAVWPYL